MATSSIDHQSCLENNFWKQQSKTGARGRPVGQKQRKSVVSLHPEVITLLQQKFDEYCHEHNQAPNVEQLCRILKIKFHDPERERSRNNSMSKPICYAQHEDVVKGDEFIAQKKLQNIERSEEYPVWPLVIPNNCSYDPTTGQMSVNAGQPRSSLVAYPPALEFIRNISSKIATVSIVGRARTGKSLIAGELYAPGKTPCPFDLGHQMDACTYGIWVSAKTIAHPYQRDTVILVFDVEGTGFHEANKQNDMQLMVITLLLSSYFIYNSKGSFDASALDEIDFVTQLTQTIHASPSDDSGQDFKKFFPIFMWLLRDVHLSPTIDGRKVPARQYFTEKVLKHERGMSKKTRARQQFREMFMEIFQKYDAFTLPMPHANNEMLRKLGTLPRVQLEREFNHQLHSLYQKIISDVKCKVLFSKNASGGEQYTQCRGPHLAEWIEQCVDSVNDPKKVPEISSMTAAVMNNVYQECKKQTLRQYEKLINEGLERRRHGDEKQPLNEKDIIDLHIAVLDAVLSQSGSTLQPQKSNASCTAAGSNQINEEQLKVFHELMEAIGHDADANEIGKRGIMYHVLTRNRELSKQFCDAFLDEHFQKNIQDMLEKSQGHEMKHVIERFKDLESKYHAQCSGPAKSECWTDFQTKRMKEALQYFEQCKGFNVQILQKEEEAAAQREKERTLKQEFDSHKKNSQQQKQLMQNELKRMENQRKAEMDQHQLNVRNAQQRLSDLQNSHNNHKAELMKQKQAEIAAMNQRMAALSQQHEQQVKSKVTEMQSRINALANKPPTVVHVHHHHGGGGGGGCLVM